jgi:hypothetical protein
MIGALRRQLRLVFSRSSESGPPQDAGDPAGDSPVLPEIEFTAYAEDCRLFGHIRLEAERLTDMLNSHDEFLLVDVLVESLIDGRVVEAEEVLVPRDELLAVQAGGPRGNSGRRNRTRPYPVVLQTGPYTVRGYLHALPGADPIASVRRRKPMVPLTDAWIDYQAADGRQQARAGTLVVNREMSNWIQLAADEDVTLPDLPLDAKPGILTKDFTGNLLTFQES